LHHGVILLGILVAGISNAHALSVLLVSDKQEQYGKVIQSIKSELDESISVRVLSHKEYLAKEFVDVDLTVSVGKETAEAVLLKSATGPVLTTLLSKLRYQKIRSLYPNALNVSAIYIDQPLSRRLALIRLLKPEIRNVGVLYTAEEHLDLGELKRMALRYKINIIFQLVESAHLSPDLLELLLSKSQVLLATLNFNIYNRFNVRNILLTSYRYRIPIIGTSKYFVDSGALGSVFSTEVQLGQQVARAIMSYQSDGQLARPKYPLKFEVAVNLEISRALKIPVDIGGLLKQLILLSSEEGGA